MKKTQFIDLFSTISKEKVSFMAISLFISFGIALYCGIVWTNESCSTSLQAAYDEGKVRTYEVSFPYGITQQEIDDFKNISGSDEAIGMLTTYSNFIKDGYRHQAKIVQLTDSVDVPIKQEGVLPTNSNEIAVEMNWAKNNGLSIGDKIVFEHDNATDTHAINTVLSLDLGNINTNDINFSESSSSGVSYLKNDTYTITSFIETAVYLNEKPESYGVNPANSFPVDCIMFTTYDAFDNKAFSDYNTVLLKNKEVDAINTFDSSFYDINMNKMSLIEKESKAFSEKKHNQIIQKASDVKKTIESKINDANNKKNEINEASLNLQKKQSELAQLELQARQLAAGGNIIEATLIQQQIKQSSESLSAQASKIPDISNIDDSIKKAEDSLSKVNEFIDDLPNYSSIVSSKTELASYILGNIFKKMLMQTRISLVLVFILIGLLVCYSTVSRLVNVQSLIIGVKKANGIPLGNIRRFYMAYSLSTIFIGIIIGITCSIPIEMIIRSTIARCFVVFPDTIYVNLTDSLLICSIYLILILVTTYICTRKTVRQRAIDLITGQYNIKSKQKNNTHRFSFSSFSCLTQTIINNTFSEKKRVFGTVIGVLGCTTLLIAAFVFRANILKGFDTQYSDCYHFNNIVYFDPETKGAEDRILSLLENAKIECCSCCNDRVFIDNDNDSYSAKVFIFDKCPAFSNMIECNNNQSKCEFEDKDIYISASYYNSCNLSYDSKLDITCTNGKYSEISDLKPVDNYLVEVALYLSKSKYNEIADKDSTNNCILLNLPDNYSSDKLNSELFNIEGFKYLHNYKNETYYEYRLIDDLTLIMSLIYFVLSLLMALFVLLTIFKIAIEEKKREVIVLKINGYMPKDIIKYLYLDTLVISIIVILIGILFGELNGNLAILGFETIVSYVWIGIDIPSGLIGASIAAVLAIIMALVSMKELKKLGVKDLDSR